MIFERFKVRCDDCGKTKMVSLPYYEETIPPVSSTTFTMGQNTLQAPWSTATAPYTVSFCSSPKTLQILEASGYRLLGYIYQYCPKCFPKHEGMALLQQEVAEEKK